MSDHEHARTEPMRCDVAVDRILEAEPSILRREGDDPLVRHLEGCASCRRLAERILEATTTLDRGLAASANATGVDELLGRVYAQLEQEGGQGSGGPREAEGPAGSEEPDVTPIPRGWRRALPLAAAAVAVGVALWTLGGEDEAPDSWSPPATAGTGQTPWAGVQGGAGGVRVAARQRFAVLKTGEPGISVVWFY